MRNGTAPSLARGSTALALAIGLLSTAPQALATNVAVDGARVSLSNNLNNGKQRVTSVQKGNSVNFGAGPNAALLSGSLEIIYVDTPANSTTLSMPSPWSKINGSATTASYKNSDAPSGPGPVFRASVRKFKSATVSAKSLGTLNISSPPGTGGVITVFTVSNGNDASLTRMCTLYSAASGSVISHKVTASGPKLSLRKGVGTTCPPSCSDGVENGNETDVDCGGGTCADCNPGQGCVVGGDCTSGVCSAGVCQAPTCSDGVQNGNELGVDCGGGTCGGCGIGSGCNTAGDCASGTCVSNVCKCPNHTYTFTVNSNSGGAFDSAEWPGGTTSSTHVTGCSATINRPNTNIDLVCTLGSAFSVNTYAGYSNCFGTGGEDGDGCAVTSCPFAGVGSCCSGRPSCSVGTNGSATSTYNVQCLQ